MQKLIGSEMTTGFSKRSPVMRVINASEICRYLPNLVGVKVDAENGFRALKRFKSSIF